ADGDVPFMALIEPPAAVTAASDGSGPTPAGIFVLRGGQLLPVACSGQPTAGGVLDLTAVVDPLADDTSGIADRSPALNDAGDVAFLTGYVTDKGFPNGGAILAAPASGRFTEGARLDGAFLAGPLLDPSSDASATDEGTPGVLVWSAGVVTLVAYPSQTIGNDRITGVTLGPAAGSALAWPSIGPDGSVVFFVTLNGGSGE